MPGPVSYVTDAITEGRLHNLDAYVKNLLGQPEYISRCNLVKQFFAPREGDYEVDAEEAEEERHRLSQGSQQSAESPGNNGSRTNLNGNGYTGLSATPRQMSTSQQGTGSQPQGQQALMKVKMYYSGDLIAIRVPSDVDYPQLCDKIRDRLKLSPDDQLQLFYKDEPTGNKPSLVSNNDLDFALQRNEKLVLFVEVV
jgi:bud emergence protein 1